MANNKIVLQTAASTNRGQPLLLEQRGSARVGEVVGGTAAECVAVCCCCPCGIVFNILVMALYKVPYGVCRRMFRMRRRRRKMINEGFLPPTRRHHCVCDCCDVRNGYPLCANDASDIMQLHSCVQPDKDALALEEEMWDKFYGAGFWRSSSRRETSQTLPNNVVVPGPQTQEERWAMRGFEY